MIPFRLPPTPPSVERPAYRPPLNYMERIPSTSGIPPEELQEYAEMRKVLGADAGQKIIDLAWVFAEYGHSPTFKRKIAIIAAEAKLARAKAQLEKAEAKAAAAEVEIKEASVAVWDAQVDLEAAQERDVV